MNTHKSRKQSQTVITQVHQLNCVSFCISDGTFEKRNGMKEPDHFGETVSRTFVFLF